VSGGEKLAFAEIWFFRHCFYANASISVRHGRLL